MQNVQSPYWLGACFHGLQICLFICSEKPMAPSNVLSMAQLRTLPLADQIKILMKNGL